tara:strand:- start:34 stop:351 length:318 start_codon:yes stop_codon:yes gene_type:complete
MPPNKAATRHLAWVLQQVRDLVNVPIKITSSYRCEEHNKNVGGSTHSQHKLGTAADLQAKGMKPQQLHAAIEDLVSSKRIPEGGLGLYNTFVHYDIRPKKARWNG